MKNFWDEIENETRPLVIYGTGNGADRLIDRLETMKLKPSAVFASSGFVRERYFRGMKVMSLDEVRELYGDSFVVLLGFGSDRKEAVELIKAAAEGCAFYAPRIPLYDPDGTFTDSAWFSAASERAERLDSVLADEMSKKVLKSIMDYRMSADIGYLAECESSVPEAYENILRPSGNEDYLDIGAYRGDTVEEFVSYARTWNSVTAVEPDVKTFSKLRENVSGIEGCSSVNAFMTSEPGEILLSSGKGRGTSADRSGTPVRCESVDSLMKGKRVSLIKIDAEGEELEILKGASDTIRTQKPKIRTAAYHKADDLFDLTDLVLSLRDDYKVYLRHYPAVPDWDTDLFFV